jgi:hypothetical protein
MTYAIVPRRYRRRKPGLGDILDDVLDKIRGSEQQQCINQANQAVAPLDAKIDDLVRTWQPTGFYTSADIRDLIGATMQVVAQAQAVVDQAAAEPNASQDSVMRATNDLARAGGRSIDYLDAARTADQQGLRVINAVGLKRWVTDTLASASSAVVTGSVIGCLRPWWVGALAVFQQVFDVAWAVAKRLVGVVVAAGETVLEVAGDLPEIYQILKWGLLAGGVYWAWIQLQNLKTSGRTIL